MVSSRWRYLAAAVLGGATMVLAVSTRKSAAPASIGEIRAHAGRVYTTKPAQRAVIRLADGTQIILKPASRLTFDANFGTSSRTVSLEGEAQFTVHADPAKPFIVAARGSLIRDLATTFVVRAYSSTALTQVVVREGRVAVQAPSLTSANTVRVNAGQLAVVTGDGIPSVTTVANVDRYFAWTDGELAFTNVPLSDVLEELSRWYDLDFRVTDSALLKRRVSGSFSERFDIAEVENMAFVVKATTKRMGRTVTLSPNR